jgi:hypothetical protein
MNKKIINTISVAASVGVIGVGTTLGVLINNEEIKILNRGNNYEQYSISTQFKNNNSLNSLKHLDGDKLSEINFENKFKSIFYTCLTNTSKFKTNASKYVCKLNYLFHNNNKSVNIDVV